METIEEENDKEIKNCERESYYNINIEEEKIQNEENSNDDEKENKTNKELSEQPEDIDIVELYYKEKAENKDPAQRRLYFYDCIISKNLSKKRFMY